LKQNTIAGIDKDEQELKALIDVENTAWKQLAEEIATLKKALADISKDLSDAIINLKATDPEITSRKKLIEGLTPLSVYTPTENNADLKEKHNLLRYDIEKLDSELARKSVSESGKKRIKELEERESFLANEISKLEKSEFACDRLVKKEFETIETRVNSMFTFVKFRMFDTQINGAEVPACITLVDGVPYADANNAGRINAGLDIIKTLSNFYNIHAPVFIDNAESVINLVKMNCQIIRLVVSELHKELHVVSGSYDKVS